MEDAQAEGIAQPVSVCLTSRTSVPALKLMFKKKKADPELVD